MRLWATKFKTVCKTHLEAKTFKDAHERQEIHWLAKCSPTIKRLVETRLDSAGEGPLCLRRHLDPRVQCLEAFSLQGGHWLLDGTWFDADDVCAEPFAEISFSLGWLWPFDPMPQQGQ